jgi:hypothetical protein
VSSSCIASFFNYERKGCCDIHDDIGTAVEGEGPQSNALQFKEGSGI